MDNRRTAIADAIRRWERERFLDRIQRLMRDPRDRRAFQQWRREQAAREPARTWRRGHRTPEIRE